MDKIKQIKHEIEKQIRLLRNSIESQGDYGQSLQINTYNNVLDLINSTIDKSTHEFVSADFDKIWEEEDCEEIMSLLQNTTPSLKEKLKELCHAWYDKGIDVTARKIPFLCTKIIGKQKELFTKDAIQCNVFWYDGLTLDCTQEQLDESLRGIGAGDGDKVKVVIMKVNEKGK